MLLEACPAFNKQERIILSQGNKKRLLQATKKDHSKVSRCTENRDISICFVTTRVVHPVNELTSSKNWRVTCGYALMGFYCTSKVGAKWTRT